jgi:hypothetical protein
MYSLLICLQFSVTAEVTIPPEIPGERLMRFLEHIDTPTAARFLSFSGSRDEPIIPSFVSGCCLHAGPMRGITTSRILTPPAEPVWNRDLLYLGIAPVAPRSH